jgi:hypothetical protein
MSFKEMDMSSNMTKLLVPVFSLVVNNVSVIRNENNLRNKNVIVIYQFELLLWEFA